MEHLAILSKEGNLLSKILSGEKTIESRWYKFKKPPFNTLKEGDMIYFKESGSQVSARARVKEIITHENLSPKKVNALLSEYASPLCIDSSYFDKIKDKKFCILIFLHNVEKISPFPVNRCYGTAWISINSIDELKT